MFVFAPDSSRKTSRAGSHRPWCCCHQWRAWRCQGRSAHGLESLFYMSAPFVRARSGRPGKLHPSPKRWRNSFNVRSGFAPTVLASAPGGTQDQRFATGAMVLGSDVTDASSLLQQLLHHADRNPEGRATSSRGCRKRPGCVRGDPTSVLTGWTLSAVAVKRLHYYLICSDSLRSACLIGSIPYGTGTSST